MKLNLVRFLPSLLLISLCGTLAACVSSEDGHPQATPADPDAAHETCTPNTRRCSEGDSFQTQVCNADGKTWGDDELCQAPFECSYGACIDPGDPCTSGDHPTYMGCEFWPTSLANVRMVVFGINDSPFTIVLANPHEFPVAAEVTGGSLTAPISVTVAAESTEVIDLVAVPELSESTQSLIGFKKAFRVTTGYPIVAYQFTQAPSDLDTYAVNDASLLLPTRALGMAHSVVSYPNVPMWNYGGMVAVVAVSEEPTSVFVTPTSPMQVGSSVPALGTGTQASFVLQQGDVLQLTGADIGDITGTEISSSAPVAVYTGHVGAYVPADPTQALSVDHLQDQLPPNDTLGSQFVVAPLGLRSRLRIVSLKFATTITFDPPSVSPPLTLNNHQYADIVVPFGTPFSVSSSENIVAAQVTESTLATSSGGWDSFPSLVLVTPIEQYRTDLLLYTPTSHPKSEIHITGPSDIALDVDGAPVTSPPTLVGSTNLAVWVVEVAPGPHKVKASAPIGAVVYGFEGVTTYAYPGGLDLRKTID